MKHKLGACRLLLCVVPLVAGCAQLGGMVSIISVAEEGAPPAIVIPSQERRFAGALEYLRAGNEAAARDQLERVIEEPATSGVTDEALFRLALLSLRDEGTKGTQRSQELIDRLRNEFPQSIWTRQALPLGAYLGGVKTLRDRQREIKTLKELNLSLSRDNREMRQSIERLKSLDLELEHKKKR